MKLALILSVVCASLVAQAKTSTTYDICRNHQTAVTSDNDKIIQTEVSDSEVYATHMNQHSVFFMPLEPKAKGGNSVAIKIQMKSGKEVILLETDCTVDKILVL